MRGMMVGFGQLIYLELRAYNIQMKSLKELNISQHFNQPKSDNPLSFYSQGERTRDSGDFSRQSIPAYTRYTPT